MKIRITPTFIEEIRKIREGVWKTGYDFAFERLLNPKYKPTYEQKRTEILKHFMKIGKEQSRKYCRAKKGSIYQKPPQQSQIEFSPSSFNYIVRDKKTQQPIVIDSITALRCFRLAEKGRKTWNVSFTNKGKELSIEGVDVFIYSKLDAIQGLTAIEIESSTMEPTFFEYWERVDWKIKGLLLPELHNTNYCNYYFPNGKNTFGNKEYIYPMYHTKETRGAAIQEIADFVKWAKGMPEYLEKLRVK